MLASEIDRRNVRRCKCCGAKNGPFDHLALCFGCGTRVADVRSMSDSELQDLRDRLDLREAVYRVASEMRA